MIWLVLSAAANNIQTVIVARLLGGLSGAAFLNVSGIITDNFADQNELQFPMIIYSRIQFIAATTTFVPESCPPVLLRRRAKGTWKGTADASYHIGSGLTPKKLVLATIMWPFLRPLQTLFLKPMCSNLYLHSSLLLRILYLFSRPSRGCSQPITVATDGKWV